MRIILALMKMRDRLIELLSEEIRETKGLTKAVIKETAEIRKSADAAQRKADAAWELVIITREEMHRPLWKKWMGR